MKKYMTKSQIAYTYIRENIVSGKFKPGDKLTLNEISDSLEVSEIPVREALKQLEAEGYVTSLPHVGFRVVEFTRKEIQELFLVRTSLEILAAELAFPLIDGGTIDNLADLIAQMDEYLQRREFEHYWKINKEFHETLYKTSGNNTLLVILYQLWDRSDRSRAIFVLNPERALASNEEHRVIFKAIEERNQKRLVEEIRKHLENALAAILNSPLVNF